MVSLDSVRSRSVAESRPSDLRRTVVSAYISARLEAEKQEEGRGYIARVAKAVGFSAPAISTVSLGKPVGEDLATALASFWKLGGYEGLLDSAIRWSNEPGVKERFALKQTEVVHPPIATSPFAVGAGAGVLDGATTEDVVAVAAALDPSAATLTWQKIYELVMQARTRRVLASLPPSEARPKLALAPGSPSGPAPPAVKDRRTGERTAKAVLEGVKGAMGVRPVPAGKGVKSTRAKPKP